MSTDEAIRRIQELLRDQAFADGWGTDATSLGNRALFLASKRIAELEAERRWIPVGERLPGEGERAVGLFLHQRMHVLSWRAGEWCDSRGEPLVLIEPTHWTPLPEPPEATDAD